MKNQRDNSSLLLDQNEVVFKIIINFMNFFLYWFLQLFIDLNNIFLILAGGHAWVEVAIATTGRTTVAIRQSVAVTCGEPTVVAKGKVFSPNWARKL